MKRRRCLSITIFMMFLVAMFSAGNVLGAEGKIKIGAAVSLTGVLAKEGSLLKDGYELWVDWLNKRGGIKIGDKVYTVEIIYYDDKSDATTSSKLTEKLITEDKVNFIFAPYSSGITYATSAIGEKYRYLTIAPLANSDALYERGYKYIFSVLPPASGDLIPILEASLKATPNPKKIAVMTADSLFPILATDGLRKKAKELKLEEVYYGKYPAKVRDLSSALIMVKSKNPDLLFAGTYLEDAILIMKQAKEIDLSPKLFGFTVGPPVEDFTQILGKDGDYSCGVEYWTTTMQWKGPYLSVQEYVDLFKKKFAREPDYYTAAGTAAGILLQIVIERTKTLDQEKLRDELQKLDIETFFGKIKFDVSGKNVGGSVGVVQIQNGKRVIVFPRPAQGVKLLYPMPPWNKR